MHDVLAVTYFWLKAGHIIFVVFWMAGLFMLPRLFVYHQECEPDSPMRQALASAGEIGQGAALPAFHRANRVLNPYLKTLFK